MKKTRQTYLDFKVDKLSNSIENTISGDSFPTDITYLTENELKQVTKKNGWSFNWKYELGRNEREVYKLTITNNPEVIQGLLSLTVEADHVYIHLLESAPYNQGKTKLYTGVPGNLIAHACKISFKQHKEGYVSFLAKTKLIEHYVKTLGAYHAGSQLMIIDSLAAQNLINKYYKS